MSYDQADAPQPVVGPQRFSIAVGSVINSATGILLDKVLGLEDITELESERLGGLLSHVETLDQLFVSPGGMSNIATYVPHWFKFCYTNQLLVSVDRTMSLMIRVPTL